jgi:hypothetical protein
MDGISKWIFGWKKNGWKTADKKPVKNGELWQALDVANQRHKVTWHWVKGHAGHPENERADELARKGMEPFKKRSACSARQFLRRRLRTASPRTQRALHPSLRLRRRSSCDGCPASRTSRSCRQGRYAHARDAPGRCPGRADRARLARGRAVGCLRRFQRPARQHHLRGALPNSAWISWCRAVTRTPEPRTTQKKAASQTTCWSRPMWMSPPSTLSRSRRSPTTARCCSRSHSWTRKKMTRRMRCAPTASSLGRLREQFQRKCAADLRLELRKIKR